MMRKIRLFAFTREALKNMVSRPATINYPDEPAVYPQRMRGHIRIDISQCISCTLCAQNCPPRAIQVDRDAGTWTIDRFDCVQCGSCVNVCPKHCLYMEQGYAPPETKKHTETFARPKQERKLPQADEDCVFCGLCARKCPKQAITVSRPDKQWQVDESLCVGCGLCADTCPKTCIIMKKA